MGWTAITAAQTDANSPGDQTFTDLLRTNDKDHEDRIKALEDPSVRVYSHFAGNQGYASGVIVGGAQVEPYFEDQFYIESGTGGLVTNQVAVAADDHRILLNGPSMIIGRAAFHFTNRVKPITFKARMKFHAFPGAFFVGLLSAGLVGNDFPAVGDTGRPARCVVLERFDASNVVFTSRVGASVNQGTQFGKPADGVWFEVKIIFTNTPGNQADCYIDGALKDNLTTAASLPTADNLYPSVLLPSVTGSDISVDSLECLAGGAILNLT